LKKVKKKWSHEFNRATTTTKTKVTKVRVEPKTFGTTDLKRMRYDLDAAWVTNSAFIQTASCEAYP